MNSWVLVCIIIYTDGSRNKYKCIRVHLHICKYVHMNLTYIHVFPDSATERPTGQ